MSNQVQSGFVTVEMYNILANDIQTLKDQVKLLTSENCELTTKLAELQNRINSGRKRSKGGSIGDENRDPELEKRFQEFNEKRKSSQNSTDSTDTGKNQNYKYQGI